MYNYAVMVEGHGEYARFTSEESAQGTVEELREQYPNLRIEIRVICPGVVCRCDDSLVKTCPMHGKKF